MIFAVSPFRGADPSSFRLTSKYVTQAVGGHRRLLYFAAQIGESWNGHPQQDTPGGIVLTDQLLNKHKKHMEDT